MMRLLTALAWLTAATEVSAQSIGREQASADHFGGSLLRLRM